MRKEQAFSLIEILIALSLIFILASMTVVGTFGFYKDILVQEDSEHILNSLRRARSYAITEKENSDWGVKFIDSENKFIVFKGSRYSDRDTSLDLEFTVDSDYQLNFDEVVFQQTTGKPLIFGES